MAKSLMKLLAIPALLAGVAQSHPANIEARVTSTCPFTNIPPENASYKVGDAFVITWNPAGLPAGTMDLVAQSALAEPIITGYGYNANGQYGPIYDYKASSIRLGSPDITAGTFTWRVAEIGNGSAVGTDWKYLIDGTYVIQYNSGAGATTGFCSTQNFYVTAA